MMKRAALARSVLASLAGLAIGITASCGSSSTGGGGGVDGGEGGVRSDGCPTGVPSSASACAPEGLDCAYGCNNGGPGNATCSGGTWSVSITDVYCPPADSGGPPPADAPFACGTKTCGPNQYCLQPCCGGPAPQCQPADDAGGCPAGFHPGVCSGSAGQGCVEDNCIPDPPKCIDDPVKEGTGCDPVDKSSRILMCQCA
jgi:hypothetical protein